MKKLILLAILSWGAFTPAIMAQKAAVIVNDRTGWHRIAETTVSFQNEKDEILVVGADRFAAIKFMVTEAPILIKSLEMYYESGDKQEVSVNTPVQVKGESRVIDLNGGERRLSKIVFYYKTLPNSKDIKAKVEVWGLKTNQETK